MAKFLVFSCVVAVLLGYCNASVITSEFITNWGDWATVFDSCPPGTAAQAFQVLSESIVSLDTTSMNGLRLYCGDPNVVTTPVLMSSAGPWGEWSPSAKRCDVNGYINGFQLRVMPEEFRQDDTATNNIRIFCDTTEEPIEGDGQIYGDWGQVLRCPEGEVVCGLKTQVESDQGNIIDDTALNNISMECCPRPVANNVASFLSKKPTTN